MDPNVSGPMAPEQVTEYTAPTAEWLAKLVGGSPILMEHYINGWFPGIGKNIMDATDNIAAEKLGRGPSVRSIEALASKTGIRSTGVGRAVASVGRRAFTLAMPYGARGKSVREFRERYYDLKPQYESIKDLDKRINTVGVSKQRKLAALERITNILSEHPYLNPEFMGDYSSSVKKINQISDGVRKDADKLREAMDLMDSSGMFSNKEKMNFFRSEEQRIYDNMKLQTEEAQRLNVLFTDETWIRSMIDINAQYILDLTYEVEHEQR